MAWLCLKSTCWVPVLSILLLSAPITLEHESGPHARPRCNGWWRSTGAIQNVVGSAKGCVTRAAFSPPLKLGWTFPLSAAPSLSRSNSCRRVKGVGGCGEQSGALGMAMANRKKFWWKDLDRVEAELAHFCREHDLAPDHIPTDMQLRNHGGMHIIHAIRQHGGVANVSKILGLRSWSDTMRSSHARRAIEPAPVQSDRAHSSGRLQFLGGSLAQGRVERPGPGAGEKAFIGAEGHQGPKHALQSGHLARGLSEGEQWPSAKYSGEEGSRRIRGGARGQGARGQREWGFFSDENRLKEELMRFGEEHTNNRHWRVMPSPAQMKAGGRADLASAVSRYGGPSAISERFGMLSYAEFAYHCEFLCLLRELQAYLIATRQEGKMPSSRRFSLDGREDLHRLVVKHGGQNVLGARLGLEPERRRAPYLYWGPFSLSFAVDTLSVAHTLALEVGENKRIVMPTEAQLVAAGREDLAAQLTKFGGRNDVARRLGMDVG